jgi:hypothetical protein
MRAELGREPGMARQYLRLGKRYFNIVNSPTATHCHRSLPMVSVPSSRPQPRQAALPVTWLAEADLRGADCRCSSCQNTDFSTALVDGTTDFRGAVGDFAIWRKPNVPKPILDKETRLQALEKRAGECLLGLSQADISGTKCHVRFTPVSTHYPES